VVTDAVLSLDAVMTAVLTDSDRPLGAVSTFVGLVRRRNLDRDVLFLEYEAWPSAIVGIHHRTGRLEVGDASIVIVAASAHRADAFAASRYIIERVKQIVPIWKHEHFSGGEVWIEGATADPDDLSARDEARRRACA